MSVTGAVSRLQTLADGLTEIRFTPSVLPDLLPGFPAAVSYIESFEAERVSYGFSRTLYTIVTEIHVARKDLARDYALLDDLGPTFAHAVLDDITPTAGPLNGEVSAVLGVAGTLGASSWAGQDTLAWTMKTKIKIGDN